MLLVIKQWFHLLREFMKFLLLEKEYFVWGALLCSMEDKKIGIILFLSV